MNIKSIGKLLADRERRSQRLFLLKHFPVVNCWEKTCIILVLVSYQPTVRHYAAFSPSSLVSFCPRSFSCHGLSLVTHAGPSKQTSLSRRQPLGVWIAADGEGRGRTAGQESERKFWEEQHVLLVVL